MKYTTLCNTDVKISKICLGTMTWGYQNSEQEGFEQMDYALDKGVNFWDTAEMYAVPPTAETYGKTETIIGNYFEKNKGAREKVVLATKIAGGASGFPATYVRNGIGPTTKESVREAVENSLKRLKTDYIDLYQVHWPTRSTNFFGKLDYEPELVDSEDVIEKALDGLEAMVKEGKIKYIGVSNETPWGLHRYLTIAEKRGFSRIVSIQNPYSLLQRHYDISTSEFCMKEDIGLLAYSPLAGGVLSGKYMNGARPEGARFSTWGAARMPQYLGTNCNQAIDKYKKLADELGISLTQLSLAWVNDRKNVNSNIIGATTMEQLKEDIDSINITLSDEVNKKIEEIHSEYPNPAVN